MKVISWMERMAACAVRNSPPGNHICTILLVFKCCSGQRVKILEKEQAGTGGYFHGRRRIHHDDIKFFSRNG